MGVHNKRVPRGSSILRFKHPKFRTEICSPACYDYNYPLSPSDDKHSVMNPPARTGGHNSRAMRKNWALVWVAGNTGPAVNIADVPPSPGVYVFKVTEGLAINRVRGTSNIVYIG